MDRKECTKCGKEKDLSEYGKSKCGKLGKASWCKACFIAYNKARSVSRKAYRSRNKDKIAKYRKAYYAKTKAKSRTQNKAWRDCNEEAVLKYRKTPQIAMGKKLRRAILGALKRNGAIKQSISEALLGSTISEAMGHLQMTAIKNGYSDFDITSYSGKDYHIDHIVPCASFDLTKEEEQKMCFNYKNLQILEASANMSKGAKIDGAVQYEILM